MVMESDGGERLTNEAVENIMSKSGLDNFFSSFLLNIKKRKEVVVACPVGDVKELKNFSEYMKNTGIAELADMLFVYKKGLEFIELDADAIHIKEKIPLGTAGAFFAAAYAGYSLGYKIIVFADVNVFIDSKKSFNECVKLAKKGDTVVFPRCMAQEDSNPQEAAGYSVNGFAFYPRAAFEEVGFHTPYTWRGGEDFELLNRLQRANLIHKNSSAYVTHPRAGYTIFHKMAERKKFYPYIGGIMKSFLLSGKNSYLSYLKFILWYLFYSFFADVFFDRALKQAIINAPNFSLFIPQQEDKEPVQIKKIAPRGVYTPSSFLRFLQTISIIFSLLITRKAYIYTDEIRLNIPRLRLLFGLIKGLFFIPFNLAEALIALKNGREKARQFIYPVKPNNAKEAIKIFADMINKNLDNIQS